MNITKKLTKLVAKNTQTEALIQLLQDGEVFSVQEARSAGIANPTAVVTRLRNTHGFDIQTLTITTKKGQTVRKYSL